MIRPRRYRDPHDLVRMRALLKLGRKSITSRYYIHTGDLNWWLFYSDEQADMDQSIYLWESKGRLLGWTLLSLRWRTFDVFTHPALYGTEDEEAMYAWAQHRLGKLVAQNGGGSIRTMWVAESDGDLQRLLERQGFTLADIYMVSMQRSLLEPLPPVRLPQGFQVRPIGADGEAPQRAAASYAAFGSDWAVDRYLQRYLRFMHSPVYLADHDLVTVAPDGRVASFCIVWPDSINRVGLFEPVGTHPEFQHMGLGKAVVSYGLARLQAGGMHTAIVTTEGENQAAQRLYASTGFHSRLRLYTYTRPI